MMMNFFVDVNSDGLGYVITTLSRRNELSHGILIGVKAFDYQELTAMYIYLSSLSFLK
jgi:hypothetical protein